MLSLLIPQIIMLQLKLTRNLRGFDCPPPGLSTPLAPPALLRDLLSADDTYSCSSPSDWLRASTTTSSEETRFKPLISDTCKANYPPGFSAVRVATLLEDVDLLRKLRRTTITLLWKSIDVEYEHEMHDRRAELKWEIRVVGNVHEQLVIEVFLAGANRVVVTAAAHLSQEVDFTDEVVRQLALSSEANALGSFLRRELGFQFAALFHAHGVRSSKRGHCNAADLRPQKVGAVRAKFLHFPRESKRRLVHAPLPSSKHTENAPLIY